MKVAALTAIFYVQTSEQRKQERIPLLLLLCKKSVYAYIDKICRGFITADGGVRVGLCGECVLENGKIINVKNISSLNIRVPHRVSGASELIFKFFNSVEKTH